MLETQRENQIHLKALTSMREAKLCLNQERMIGTVPGVEVGDIFCLQVEMSMVGLHNRFMQGIDYMSAIFGNVEDSVATCVVSSSVYDDDQDDPNVLVYTGSGSEDKAQKLVKGNRAIMGSRNQGNLIRVIRSATDLVSCQHEKTKVYIYDGLYKITKSWTKKGRFCFRVFRNMLVREPGQPNAFAMWKRSHKWREDPSSRDHLLLPDLSNGVERVNVCVVNEIDDETAPVGFTYTTKLVNRNQNNFISKLKGCACTSSCRPGDNKCSCLPPNGSDRPYSHSGKLVSQKVMLFECNDLCAFSGDCRNRQVQRGSYLSFSIHKIVVGAFAAGIPFEQVHLYMNMLARLLKNMELIGKIITSLRPLPPGII